MSRKNNRINKIKTTIVNCPHCGSPKRTILYGDMIDVEDNIPGKYIISRCLKCNLVYLSLRPTLASLPLCYRHDYHVYHENLRTHISKYIYSLKHRYDFSLLKKIVGHVPKSLLDVGFGSGSFLLEIRRRWGYAIDLAGIELDKPLTGDLAKAGISVYIGELEKMKPVKKFEVVTMNEVLEHVYNPVLALQAAGKWLRKDGLLIGEVPDWNAPWKSIFPRHWQGFQIPRHLTFFTKETLTETLSKAGYETISIGNRINFGDIGVSLSNLIVNKINPDARVRLSPLYIPLVTLTVPVIIIMDKLFHTPGILEFVARKK